jgi:phosphatidylglycerol---prolipoprotein diacylglyceryl transferase
MASRTKRNRPSQRSAASKAQPAKPQPSKPQAGKPQPGGSQPGGSVSDGSASSGSAPRKADAGEAQAQTLPAGLSSRKGRSQASADGPGPDLGRPANWLAQPKPAGKSAGVNQVKVRDDARAARTGVAAAQATTARAVSPAEESTEDVPAWAAKVLEEVLTCTYWLDPGESGEPFSATIRFAGRKAEGANGRQKQAETFSQEETVDGIIPGSGPVAITAEVHDVSPGEWTVTARPTGRVPFRPLPAPAEDPGRTPWPRRIAIGDTSGEVVRTARRPFSKVPGVTRFAYAGLIGLGVLVGLALEVVLLKHAHYAALGPLLYSLAAITAGLLGAKVWYIAEQRGRKFDGWCIQGFITGTAAVIVAIALAGAGVPAGAFLGAAATALLLGMAIGRPGCFWAGCCVGRPTAARWGIWSSDRRVGCRRNPAQLVEALASLVIGLAVLSYELVAGLAHAGPVAVAGLAAYTLCRQFALSLRAVPPSRWRYGRQATVVAAAIALIASLVVLAVG